MIKVIVCLIQLIFLSTFSAISQCADGGVVEINCVRDSILKNHRNDEFYLHIRYLPDVRESVEDYVLKKEKNRWIGNYYIRTFNPPPWEGDNRTPRKVILKTKTMHKDSISMFLKSIQSERLINFKNVDSVHIDNSKLMYGKSNYFIMICSNGNVRLIEYPLFLHYDTKPDWKKQNIYWQSNYIDNLISKFEKAFK